MAPGSTKHENDSLIQRPNDSFQQQGQFDWFALAKATVSWSVEVFARFSAANVDPYTVMVAQNLGFLFKLSSQGRQFLDSALASLACVQSVENALWFGIGTRHVVRELVKTEQGSIYLGLCGSLTTCYSENISAEILSELVSISRAPVELAPSLNDWKNLVHACNGALHSSQFPVYAEQLINLYPSIPVPSAAHQSGPFRSAPSSIAKALLAVGDVTRDAVKAITIVGGADAAWLAAVSEWLFGLYVRIIHHDGTTLHEGSPKDSRVKAVQVLICFTTDKNDLPELRHPSMELQCLERVYHLDRMEDLITTDATSPQGNDYQYRVSGRVPWDCAFAKTFHLEFKSLLKMENVVGYAIGSLARITAAIARNENDVYEAMWMGPNSAARWSRHNDNAYGPGFIDNLVYWFPEFEPLQNKMEEAARLSYADAKSTYETQYSLIQTACECAGCGQKSSLKGDYFCKTAILETVLQINQILSVVSCDTNLTLKRHGIEGVYQRILHTARDRKDTSTIDRVMRDVHGVAMHAIYQADLMTLHTTIIELFSGERPLYLVQESAHSQHGICTFLDILREVSDSKQLTGRFHVIPGRIEYHSRPYDSLKDAHPSPMEKLSLDAGKNVDLLLENLANYEPYTARVRQAVDGLQIWFEAASRSGIKPAVLEPSLFTSLVNISRGFTHCTKQDCPEVYPQAKHWVDVKGQKIEMLGKTLQIVREKTLARCVVLSGTATEYGILLRGDECLQCCLRSALACPRSKILIISE